MFKKGDRVECTYKGEKVYGVVKSGGQRKVTIILDGGEQMLSGNPMLFKYSDMLLPKDSPNIMDKWGVVGYKCLERASNETDCMEAYITFDGRKVIAVSNEGCGGPNNYHAMSPNTDYKAFHELVERFRKDANEWVALFSKEKHIEVEDTWVDWYVKHKPYGVTAKKYWSDWDAEMAQWKKEKVD